MNPFMLPPEPKTEETPKTIIAVDPGKAGAIVARFPTGTLYVKKCPEAYTDIFNELRDIAEGHPGTTEAVIENVHAFPARMIPHKCPTCGKTEMMRQPQGSKSIWTFATNYQAHLSSLYALGIPVLEVTPNKWMKAICGTLPKEKPERKRALKAEAQKLYPDVKVTLYNADALLLLWWYSEQRKR